MLIVNVPHDQLRLMFPVLDPESQRKRTVQNVLDLRQNLEETMSSLRGSQLSHRYAIGGLDRTWGLNRALTAPGS